MLRCAVQLACLASTVPPPPPAAAGGPDGLGQSMEQPLVKPPRGFEPLWEDDTSYADVRLVVWRPIPYPG